MIPDGAGRAAALADLAARATQYAVRARSDGTRRGYRSAWAAYDAILGLGPVGMRSVLQGDVPPAHAEHITEMVLVASGVMDAAEIATRRIDSKVSLAM